MYFNNLENCDLLFDRNLWKVFGYSSEVLKAMQENNELEIEEYKMNASCLESKDENFLIYSWNRTMMPKFNIFPSEKLCNVGQTLDRLTSFNSVTLFRFINL